MTIVIVRGDLLDHVNPMTPEMYRYDTHVKENSIVNTSPVFACYMAKLMLEWVKDHGGIEKMVDLAKQRSKLLYDSIRVKESLVNNIAPDCRSTINVVFKSAKNNVIESIISSAQEEGLTGLEGHRLVGGIRASMYNGTPMDAVQKLSKIIREVC